jgi:hypothetical protein
MQVNTSLTRQAKGSGIGLSLVKNNTGTLKFPASIISTILFIT